MRPGSRTSRTPTASWPGRRWRGLAWSRAATAPFAAPPSPRTGMSLLRFVVCALMARTAICALSTAAAVRPPVSPDSLRQWGLCSSSGDLAAVWGRRQQRRHRQSRQCRRCCAVGRRLSVQSRWRPGDAKGVDESAAGLQPVRSVRPQRARLGYSLCRRPLSVAARGRRIDALARILDA